MKSLPADPMPGTSAPGAALGRRSLLAGAGVAVTAGAVAAVVARRPADPAPQAAAAPRRDEASEGYRLSAHVLRYYETIRV
jgi:hypothetical protein